MAVRTATQRADALQIARKPRSLWRDAFRRLTRNKMAIASLVVIISIALLAALAPVLPLQDPVGYMSRETDPGGGGTSSIQLFTWNNGLLAVPRLRRQEAGENSCACVWKL